MQKRINLSDADFKKWKVEDREGEIYAEAAEDEVWTDVLVNRYGLDPSDATGPRRFRMAAEQVLRERDAAYQVRIDSGLGRTDYIWKSLHASNTKMASWFWTIHPFPVGANDSLRLHFGFRHSHDPGRATQRVSVQVGKKTEFVQMSTGICGSCRAKCMKACFVKYLDAVEDGSLEVMLGFEEAYWAIWEVQCVVKARSNHFEQETKEKVDSLVEELEGRFGSVGDESA